MLRMPNKHGMSLAVLLLVLVSSMSCMKGSTLTSISITPVSPVILLGSSQQLTATAAFSDGGTLNWTTAVTWSSDNPEVTVSNAVGSIGLITAVTGTTGTVKITATDIANKEINDSVMVTVANAPLVSIVVSPTNPVLTAGQNQQFTAYGIYADGQQRDITQLVTWMSSNSEVATISNSSGSFGLAQAVATGATDISATDPATQASGNTLLSVTQ